MHKIETVGLTGTNKETLRQIVAERTLEGFSISKEKKMKLSEEETFYQIVLTRKIG